MNSPNRLPVALTPSKSLVLRELAMKRGAPLQLRAVGLRRSGTPLSRYEAAAAYARAKRIAEISPSAQIALEA